MASVTQKEIQKAAQTAGIPVWLFAAVIGLESGGRHDAVSSAGARGPAQLMPGTARALEQRYGIDTSTPYGNLLGGAYYLKEQKERFRTWPLALSAYNTGPAGSERGGRVEASSYVQRVLDSAAKFKKQFGPVTQPGVTQAPKPGTPATPAVLGPDPYSTGMAALQGLSDLVKGQYDPIKTLGYLQEARALEPQVIQPAQPGTPPKAGSVAPVASGKPLKGGGGWGGTQGVVQKLAQGLGLNVSSTKRDTKYTESGGVSDHWKGNKNAYANDLSGSVENMDAAAVKLMKRLGIDYTPGTEIVQTLHRNGYRIQVLYRTNVGGNHFDHIHIGVRREG